jgi:hypothetical protein
MFKFDMIQGIIMIDERKRRRQEGGGRTDEKKNRRTETGEKVVGGKKMKDIVRVLFLVARHSSFINQ